MIIKDLIHELEKYPPDCEVQTYDDDCDRQDMNFVSPSAEYPEIIMVY